MNPTDPTSIIVRERRLPARAMMDRAYIAPDHERSVTHIALLSIQRLNLQLAQRMKVLGLASPQESYFLAEAHRQADLIELWTAQQSAAPESSPQEKGASNGE